VPDVERVELAPGYSISRIIKGGWQLAGGHGAVDPADAQHDMAAFADAGITTFDCADIYTGVEALIGAFLSAHARRAAVQVHTKCVPDLDALARLTPGNIEHIVDRSRQRLGRDVLDLVQLHWWDYALGDFVAAALVLDRLRACGKVRNVGVTNFGTPQLASILEAGVPIISHQLQYSLLDRRPSGRMTELCAANGIGLLCYGALAGGFMSERWLGAREPRGPMENRSLTKYKLVIDESGGWERFQALLDTLHDVGEAHGAAIGAVAVRWVLDQPGVAAVIAGARNTRHLEHTLRAFRIRLTEPDKARIASVIGDGPPGDVYELERDREGRHGRIMRYDLNRT
jgi:aryl-alcohol dehydrogenase-like predicted oxidoreductase